MPSDAGYAKCSNYREVHAGPFDKAECRSSLDGRSLRRSHDRCMHAGPLMRSPRCTSLTSWPGAHNTRDISQDVSIIAESVESPLVTSHHVFSRHLRRSGHRPEGGKTAWAIAAKWPPTHGHVIACATAISKHLLRGLAIPQTPPSLSPWQTSSRSMVCSDTTRCRSSRLGPGTLSTSAIGAGRHLHTSYDAACISACWASAFVR